MTRLVEVKKRYEDVGEIKADGVTYTPRRLAEFVADRMIANWQDRPTQTVRILDPAVGHGELLLALLEKIDLPVCVFGYETDANALAEATQRILDRHPNADIQFKHGSFLDHVIEDFSEDLFGSSEPYDLIIANPPYVRTQILGTKKANQLAAEFGLSGRVDLYHAFLHGMAKVLAPTGVAGFIVSNRFMTTKGGASTRASMMSDLRLREVYDLGDTKIFDAAVLPAVLIGQGLAAETKTIEFHSIYQTKSEGTEIASDPIAALEYEGTVSTTDGRTFRVQHGTLTNSSGPSDTWRLASNDVENWLASVSQRTWGTFRSIGKIRVGIKTCADKVFIPKSWDEDLELHRPLTTHHIGRRFRPLKPNRKVLYPHDSVNGRKQTVDIDKYPLSKQYLEMHRTTLEARTYVIAAGREWYEIWVPQSPETWAKPKLVFRDISEKPTFWIDKEGTVVNGDCYWLVGDEELLWLALGVANSSFIESFYDKRFNNKLYAGRRRFITQYVEQFPLPDPTSKIGKMIIENCQRLYDSIEDVSAAQLEQKNDALVWEAFGLPIEEI